MLSRWRQIDTRPPVFHADVMFDLERSTMNIRNHCAVDKGQASAAYGMYLRIQLCLIEEMLAELRVTHRAAALQNGPAPKRLEFRSKTELLGDEIFELQELREIAAKRLLLVDGKWPRYPHE